MPGDLDDEALEARLSITVGVADASELSEAVPWNKKYMDVCDYIHKRPETKYSKGSLPSEIALYIKHYYPNHNQGS